MSACVVASSGLFGQKILPRNRAATFVGSFAPHHKAVLAERLPVEEGGDGQTLVDVGLVARLRERRGIDAKMLDETRCSGAVRMRTVDQHRAAVHQFEATVDMVFIAFGMTAEIVVIVEDQIFSRSAFSRGRNAPPKVR